MPTPSSPQVIRQELHWVQLPESRRVYMGHDEHPYRIWTLYHETSLHQRPTLPIRPVHNQNAFLEDFVHDWNFHRDAERNEFFIRYASRVVDRGVWILVEFTDKDSNPFTRRRL